MTEKTDCYYTCRCAAIVRGDYISAGCPSCGWRGRFDLIPRGLPGEVKRTILKEPRAPN